MLYTESAVMLATLNVHESMSQKLVQEAAAPLVLPELRTMGKGPRQFPLYIRKLPLIFRVVLNINQFARFMRFVSYTYLCAIANDVMTYLQHDQNLGERVEREHGQYLRNSQRIEDWSSGFDVHGSSNSVPKLGETVDFENLIAGPAMALTSSSGLEASTTTGVNGVAKSTSWEDGVCGRILDGSDVSVSLTQRTLTDASTSQLQVRSPTPGSVRPSLSFPVTAAHSLLSRLKPRPAPLRPVGSILLNTQAIAPPPRQVGPIPPPIYPHSQSSFANRATSSPMAPAFSPIPSHMRFGVTPTPQAQPMSMGAAPLTSNLPLSTSKPNYNVAFASSSVSMTPSIPSTSCPTVWTTSLASHPSASITTDAATCCADEWQHYGAL